MTPSMLPANGIVVGRIFLSPGTPQDRQWMWSSGHSADSIKRAAHTSRRARRR
jgi:hypothetical protein